jgi:hypothetical protein
MTGGRAPENEGYIVWTVLDPSGPLNLIGAFQDPHRPGSDCTGGGMNLKRVNSSTFNG